MRSARTVLAAAAIAIVFAALAPRSISQPQSNADPGATIPQVNSAPVTVTPQAAAPTLKVYTRETVVDITVTDAKGNPVHGLTRDDFTVKEDNKPQSIRSFKEYASAAPAIIEPSQKLPPNVYTNLQPPPPSSALDILLLDFVNTAPVISTSCCQCPGLDPSCSNAAAGPHELARAIGSQNAVKREAIKFLQTMPAGTRVAVIGMSWPSSLRILAGFNSDPAILSAAVNTMKYSTNSIVTKGGPDFCQEADGRSRMTLEVLKQIASDLTGTTGKKNLIWLTVGTPYVTNPGMRPECLPDYSADLLKVYNLLTAAQVAIFPVDARGLETMPDALLTISGQIIPSADTSREALQEFAVKTAQEHLALEAYAEATGGQAFYNSNDLAGLLTQAANKGANYYTLTYSPPGQKYNWAHHNIKVELAATAPPGLHLVYRKTYDAVDPATIKPPPGLTLALAADTAGPPDMSTQMTRAMPTSEALPFDVKVEPDTEPAKPDAPAVLGILSPKLQGKPLTRYTLHYAILGSGIALPKGQGGLEFDLAAYDSEGSLVTSLRQAVKLNYTPADQLELVSSAFPYTEQIDLPEGQLFLRIGVLDRTSNKLGTLEIAVSVPRK